MAAVVVIAAVVAAVVVEIVVVATAATAAVVVETVVVAPAPAALVVRARHGGDGRRVAERLGLGDGEALERAERNAEPLDADRCARRWTVSRTISVRTSGADWAAAGAPEVSFGGCVARGERDGGEGAEGDHGHPGGDLMA